MFMSMKGTVKFIIVIKTVFIGAGTSKRDERLQTLSVGWSYDWVIDSTNTLELLKAKPEYSKMS